MLREIKKINSGVVPPKKWKFFDDLEFLKSGLNKEKKFYLRMMRLKTLITFYSENPAQ